MLAIWENHNTLVWSKIAVVTKFLYSSVTAWVAKCEEVLFIIHVRLNVFWSNGFACHRPRLPNRGPYAAREVVLCGPRCDEFVSRFLKFFIFYRLKYTCHQNTPKLYLLFLLWAYHPKTCITNASKISQLFRFGLNPYKLATLRATTGLIYRLVLSHKTYQNQRICNVTIAYWNVTKTFVARNEHPHVKVARNTKKVGQAYHRALD